MDKNRFVEALESVDEEGMYLVIVARGDEVSVAYNADDEYVVNIINSVFNGYIGDTKETLN